MEKYQRLGEYLTEQKGDCGFSRNVIPFPGGMPSSLRPAQTCQCKVLLTEDLQHGQEFGTVRVIDPFASPERTPADVLKTLAQ